MQKIQRFLSSCGTVRGSAAITTDLVRGIPQIRQGTDITAIALGRAATGAVLLSSLLPDHQKISLHIAGNGPIGSIYADADPQGRTRAYCEKPQIEVADGCKPPKSVGQAVGAGFLHIFKISNNEKQQIHRGTVELSTGEIGDDIAYYLNQSEQIPNIVAVGTSLTEDGYVTVAGGLVIELLPGFSSGLIDHLESNANSIEGFTALLRTNDPMEIINTYLTDIEYDIIDASVQPRFHCGCSKLKVLHSIKAMGKAITDDWGDDEENLEVKCQFCQKIHILTKDEVMAIT